MLMHDILTSGYQAILSAGWYLDQQIPDYPTYYLWIDTWMGML